MLVLNLQSVVCNWNGALSYVIFMVNDFHDTCEVSIYSCKVTILHTFDQCESIPRIFFRGFNGTKRIETVPGQKRAVKAFGRVAMA